MYSHIFQDSFLSSSESEPLLVAREAQRIQYGASSEESFNNGRVQYVGDMKMKCECPYVKEILPDKEKLIDKVKISLFDC